MPDPRTHDRQQHCSAPVCKRASKAWRQRRWLAKKENRNYFRDKKNTGRVQEWRRENKGYWRRKPSLSENALQDDCSSQLLDKQEDKPDLIGFALQDDCLMQPAVVVGLISNLTGSALQDDIASTLRGFHARGQQIMGIGPGIDTEGEEDDDQNAVVSATPSKGPPAVQLGGPASGP
jgi:hypothetical protein